MARSRLALMVVVLAVCSGPLVAAEPAYRVWTSRDGKFTTKARLIQLQGDSVSLKRTDGTTIRVPLRALSKEDVEFVRSSSRRSQVHSQGRTHWGDKLGAPVNLLEGLDLAAEVVTGAPKLSEAGLVLPQNSRSVLHLPANVPPQYELTLHVTRVAGEEALFLGLPIDGRRVALGLDGYKRFSELSQLDDSVQKSKVTRYRGRRLQLGKPHELVITVHHNHIHVSIDGATFLNWHGDSQRLGNSSSTWKKLREETFGMVGYGAEFLISKLEMRPIVESSFVARRIASQDDPMAAVALVEAGDSSGSGFMAARHLVVTNEHVIRGAVAADLKVHFPESKQDYRVESVVYEDADRDLAILLVRADVLPIALAYDDSAAVGDTVKVLGNPSLGGGVILKNARTSGRVAAEVRIQSADFLQLDATVNPGSSGGPILNEDGQVIAVTAMKATAEGEQLIREGMAALNESFGKRSAESLEAGIAFGIPSRDAARALDIVLQQSAADAAAVSARHDLQIVFERLVALAGLRYVQALAFSGQHIKHQAFVARSRGLAKGMVEMLPAARDMSVAKAFESGAAESVIAKLSENLSRDVEALKSNRSVSAQARKGLRLIVDLLGDLEAFAHQNHRNYVQFSQQMLRYQQVMRQTFEALDKELNEKSQ